MSETRVCKRCGVEYPATTEYFTTSKGNKGNDKRYLRTTCRKCTNADVNARYHRVVKHEIAKKRELEGPKERVYTCKLLPYSMELGCYLKICPVCKRELPATKEYFYPVKGAKHGIGGSCKECRGFQFTPILNIAEGYARCPKCGLDLLINEENFHIRKGSKIGFKRTCRKCIGIQEAQYRKDNPDIMHERDRYQDSKRKDFKKEWRYRKYWENPELYAQKNKENHEAHRDKRLAYNRQKYRENPELRKEQHKKWRRENPDIYRASINKTRQKRRAIKKRLLHDFTTEQWIACKEYFTNQCAYCGADAPLDHDLDQEHFVASDNDGPYTVTNIVSSCRSCNSSKHTEDYFSWYPRQPFYSKERDQKMLKYLGFVKHSTTQQLSLF